ncbi:hypothetical protein G9F72_018825 [Clostridium estertheticum]|uniref:hypothetical protein n=1 Tax=Clostridium estertheticum TaxID=238834 RepID=UPI0013E90374|nr:hypothetical protein [Clostridium estertheticum]MBZ9688387.1 hypothetical protein [Clostridium estertheticum]
MNIFNDDSNFVYLLNAMGQKIVINNIEVQALISNQKDKTIDYKKIKTIVPYNTGDIVEFQGYKWIIISEVVKTNTIYKAIMRKCNNLLRYKAKVDGIDRVISINSIIDKGTLSIAEGKYISTIGNELSCQVGYSQLNIIKAVPLGFRFILNGTLWSVLGIDNISSVVNEEQGVIIIKLKSDVSGVDDNFTTGLAFNSVTPVITTPIGNNFTIELPTTITYIEQNKTFQIETICRNNSTVITTPALTFVVSDTTICSVDTTGLITGIKVGTTAITVKFENVAAILNVNITAVIVGATYQIVSSTGSYDYINLSALRTWKCVNNDLTAITTGEVFTFTLEQSSLNPTITSQMLIILIDNILPTSCRLNANTSVKGSFLLVATMGSTVIKKQIRIKGLTDL